MATTILWNGVAGDWATPSNWTPAVVPGILDTARIGLGPVTISTNTDVANLDLSGGTLTATADLSVKNTLKWTAGTLTGVGQVVVDVALNISGDSFKFLSTSGGLVNGGTATWVASTNKGTSIGYMCDSLISHKHSCSTYK